MPIFGDPFDIRLLSSDAVDMRTYLDIDREAADFIKAQQTSHAVIWRSFLVAKIAPGQVRARNLDVPQRPQRLKARQGKSISDVKIYREDCQAEVFILVDLLRQIGESVDRGKRSQHRLDRLDAQLVAAQINKVQAALQRAYPDLSPKGCGIILERIVDEQVRLLIDAPDSTGRNTEYYVASGIINVHPRILDPSQDDTWQVLLDAMKKIGNQVDMLFAYGRGAENHRPIVYADQGVDEERTKRVNDKTIVAPETALDDVGIAPVDDSPPESFVDNEKGLRSHLLPDLSINALMKHKWMESLEKTNNLLDESVDPPGSGVKLGRDLPDLSIDSQPKSIVTIGNDDDDAYSERVAKAEGIPQQTIDDRTQKKRGELDRFLRNAVQNNAPPPYNPGNNLLIQMKYIESLRQYCLDAKADGDAEITKYVEDTLTLERRKFDDLLAAKPRAIFDKYAALEKTYSDLYKRMEAIIDSPDQLARQSAPIRDVPRDEELILLAQMQTMRRQTLRGLSVGLTEIIHLMRRRGEILRSLGIRNDGGGDAGIGAKARALLGNLVKNIGEQLDRRPANDPFHRKNAKVKMLLTKLQKSLRNDEKTNNNPYAFTDSALVVRAVRGLPSGLFNRPTFALSTADNKELWGIIHDWEVFWRSMLGRTLKEVTEGRDQLGDRTKAFLNDHADKPEAKYLERLVELGRLAWPVDKLWQYDKLCNDLKSLPILDPSAEKTQEFWSIVRDWEQLEKSRRQMNPSDAMAAEDELDVRTENYKGAHQDQPEAEHLEHLLELGKELWSEPPADVALTDVQKQYEILLNMGQGWPRYMSSPELQLEQIAAAYKKCDALKGRVDPIKERLDAKLPVDREIRGEIERRLRVFQSELTKLEVESLKLECNFKAILPFLGHDERKDFTKRFNQLREGPCDQPRIERPEPILQNNDNDNDFRMAKMLPADMVEEEKDEKKEKEESFESYSVFFQGVK